MAEISIGALMMSIQAIKKEIGNLEALLSRTHLPTAPIFRTCSSPMKMRKPS